MTFVAALSAIGAVLSAYVALIAARLARAPGFAEQRWFLVAALSAALYTLGNMFTNWPVPDPWVILISSGQLTVGAIHVTAWLGYSRAHLRRRRRPLEVWLERVVLVLGLLAAVPGLAFTGEMGQHVFAAMGVVYKDPRPTALGEATELAIFLAFVAVTVRYGLAWRARQAHAGLHFITFATLLVMTANDVLVQWGAVSMPYLLDAAPAIPLATVAYSLTSRFAEDATDLARLRLRLEELVLERTRQLEQTQEALHQAEKLGALGQFAAGVAHEVNNPAAVVSANLTYLGERLEAGPLEGDEVRESLEESRGAMNRIGTIVRQLLDASRVAAHSARARMTSVSLSEIAAQAIRTARARFGNRVELRAQVPAGLYALGEEQLLVQVAINLVINAVQAIPPERAGGWVRIVAERVAGGVRLVVEDNGTGMSADTMKRLFEPFFTTKSAGSGTGLGLAVSRGFVASMGGSLRFESELGKGTRAVLFLQEAAVPGPVAADHEELPVDDALSLRLLLVDDEPHALSSLRRLLAGRYEVAVAGGVEEALMRVGEHPYDVVLCDLLMPDGGGERFYRELERRAPDLAARVVFLTGGAASESLRRFLANQPQPVVHKPLDVAVLAEVARRLHHGARAHR